MALVDYDSSDSEQELPRPAPPPKEKSVKPGRPTFEKLVDKSNPGVIRVNLTEEATKSNQGNEIDGAEPPAKRAKTSTFGGFNSLLPAPKRAGGSAGRSARGANLKTDAAPSFTREPITHAPSYDHAVKGSNGLEMDEDSINTTVAPDEKPSAVSEGIPESNADEQTKKTSTMFKPLSVARKPAKKKPISTESPGIAASVGTAKAPRTGAAPKVSLFSIGNLTDKPDTPTTSTSTYQPLVYTANSPDEPKLSTDDTWEQAEAVESSVPQPEPFSSNQAESLDSIAADLNLSASARRQLLGRHQRDSRNASVKITTFNTDQEYASNEALRQSGEIVQHNAVRGIAPGKHSLKQLVNAATSQKDALEEQFAAGRRNKSEAGAKYGW